MSQATLNAPQRRKRAPEDLLLGFASIRTELLHTLTMLLGSPDDAQDALQETFLKCWKARHREELVVNFKAWIFRVGVNTARDLQRSAWKRKSRPLSPLVSPDDPQENSPPAQIVHGETIERIRQALTTLRAEEREVFLLRQNSDMTYDQIAQLRNVPVGTIKTQMRSALHKLRMILNEASSLPNLPACRAASG
jgi:RNA polymerase sigma-70 factor (ECF subfamily)